MHSSAHTLALPWMVVWMSASLPGILLASPAVTWFMGVSGFPNVHEIHLHISSHLNPENHGTGMGITYRCAGSESLDLILLKDKPRLFRCVHCTAGLQSILIGQSSAATRAFLRHSWPHFLTSQRHISVLWFLLS